MIDNKPVNNSLHCQKKLTCHFSPCKARVLTNNEAVGNYGPTILKYHGVLNHEVKVSSEHRGIQLWTVPTSGIWSIEARGASGADGILAGGSGNKRRGGYGAIVKAKFQLHKGKILKILVAHEGLRDYREAHRPGGGGGGTFVVNQDGRPLIVAGGGGGGGLPKGGKNVSFYNLTTIKTIKK